MSSKKDNIVKEKTTNKDKNMIDNKKASKKALKEPKKAVKKEDTTITKNVEFNLLEVIILIIITGIVVSLISGLIVYNNYDKINTSNIVIKESDSAFKEFIDNYNTILNKYVDKVDSKELLDAAIAGMYNYLGDDYSVYIDKDTTDTLDDELTGEYVGIGVEISSLCNNDGSCVIMVNRIFKDSPAEKAGLQIGDIIYKLDGEDLSKKDGSYVSNKIKNGNQESFNITVIRNNEEVNLTLKREKVVINSVSSKLYDDTIYLKIDSFSANSSDLIKSEIDKYDKSINKLVVDLRDNTGGYLSAAYDVSNLFIEKGKNIYQIKNRDGITNIVKAENDIYRKFNNIVVLVNENTASASEIFSLALMENNNAKVVGVKTYGKGSVQETQMLESGAMVKYTIAYWFSPSGKSINEVGITPDVEEKDVSKQLDKALEVVRK